MISYLKKKKKKDKTKQVILRMKILFELRAFVETMFTYIT